MGVWGTRSRGREARFPPCGSIRNMPISLTCFSPARLAAFLLAKSEPISSLVSRPVFSSLSTPPLIIYSSAVHFVVWYGESVAGDDRANAEIYRWLLLLATTTTTTKHKYPGHVTSLFDNVNTRASSVLEAARSRALPNANGARGDRFAATTR